MEALRGAPFDLIILDKEMPGLTGLELLPILSREFPGVPVVLVTAFGGPHVAASALRLGAASYLEVLDSETRFFNAQLSLAQAQLRELQSLVQIYRSLGGGWQP